MLFYRRKNHELNFYWIRFLYFFRKIDFVNKLGTGYIPQSKKTQW